VTAATGVDALAEEYRRVGFAVARGYLDGDLLARLTGEADELVGRFVAGHRSGDFWCYDEPGRALPILYRVHNLEVQGTPEIGALFADGPLHRLAARILGDERPRATVCAMVVKTRGVAGVPWHRDRADVPPGSALNLSVYLDPSRPDNGCFEAVPGSHLLPDDAGVEAVRAAGPRVLVPAEPGDVLIHDVRLVHASGDNAGDIERRSIITEFAATAGVPA
jgi:phytanoyl-CoA hydroxylase